MGREEEMKSGKKEVTRKEENEQEMEDGKMIFLEVKS